MELTTPLQIVRSFMKAMEVLDYDTGLQFIAADCDYINPPPINAVKGPEGVRAFLEPFFAPMLENEFRILCEAEAGQTVFLERLDRHRLKDKWVELPVTGVYEVKGGLITRWRDYFDAATIMAQWPSAPSVG